MSGPQQSMMELFRCLDRSVFEPSVICQSTGPLTEELTRQNIPYYLVPEMGREIRPWRDARAYWALKRLFHAERFDLVHTHSAKPRVIAGIAARRAGIPVINHVRCYSFNNGTPRWREAIYRRVERFASRSCDETIFVNNEERLDALATGLAAREHARTIYNGVDLSRFSPANKARFRESFRRVHGFGENELLILFLGRLEEPKQPLIFPQIGAELEHRMTRDWRMLICGDGSYRGPLEAAVSRAGLGNRVLCLGWHAQPEAILHACDVVLLPSIWEGCPRVLLEAHAAGLPSVGSRICGIREVIADGETGILVETRDAPGYAATVASLADDRLQRERMGRAARKRAETYFDSRRNHGEVMSLYYSLLDAAPSREVRRAA